MRRSSDAVVVGKHVLGCFHDRFWCRDLFQHSVIHYGAHKTPFGYRSALIAIGSFSKRFASGLKAAGSFLMRSISIQDAMSRAPLNCRDATQPTLCITCGRLRKINRFAAAYKTWQSKWPKQQRQFRASISRSQFYNRVFHSTERPLRGTTSG